MNEIHNEETARAAEAMLTMYAESEEMTNSLSALCEAIGTGFGEQTISDTSTLFQNNRWYLITLMRQLLSQLYTEHGIIQTFIDQPVEDSFRAGFEIKTSQLSKDEIERLKVYLEEQQVIQAIMQSIIWARLFGLGGLMVITTQPSALPLNINKIKEDSDLTFRGVDKWELLNANYNATAVPYPNGDIGANYSEFYNYYGIPVHRSRVMLVKGKEAPSFIRPRLQGGGLSEVERVVRSLNQYMKNQDVIFELLDEAKIDIFKIKGFSASLLTKNGTSAVTRRIAMANQMKNYQSALTMDSEDDYDQKQIVFTGLAEILTQIRQGICGDLKFPMTKLFGLSATGFNSGEDDLENYNSMCESQIRGKSKFIVVAALRVCCKKLFGYVPDDLMIEWSPMRMLDAKEEEEVKDSQFNRVITSFTTGLSTAQEAKQSINKDSLLGVEINETTDALPPMMAAGDDEDEVKSASGKAEDVKTK